MATSIADKEAELTRRGWTHHPAENVWSRDDHRYLSVSSAFNTLGGLEELDRQTLFEAGWELRDDGCWIHPVAGVFNGKDAMSIHSRAVNLRAKVREDILAMMAENLVKHSEFYKP